MSTNRQVTSQLALDLTKFYLTLPTIVAHEQGFDNVKKIYTEFFNLIDDLYQKDIN